MAVGASKPTVIADKEGFFSVKNQMLVTPPYFFRLNDVYQKIKLCFNESKLIEMQNFFFSGECYG